MTVKLEDVGLVFVDISDEDGIAVIEVSEQGPAGPPGATGPAGPAGATGPQGPIGATGVQGSTGSPGPSGPQGADSTVPGEMGATGSTGPDGITGSTGVRGSRWFVGASSPTIGNLEGDLYYDEINDVLYVYTAGNYEYYTNLKGADGVDGATGPFGDTGATGPISMVPGPTGPQGFTGATGNTGATGPSGVFSPQADQTITGNISGGAAIPTGLTPGQVRSTIGLGTAALAASTDFDLSGSASAAQAAAIAAAATDATAKADAKVADAINDGVTTVAPSQNAVFDALALKADLASPALTGDPTAPTQAQGNNSTRLATTAYVQTEAGLLVPKSTVTTKGDLIVATGPGAVTRRPVGSNGQVLTADSTQTDGVKWADAEVAAEVAADPVFSGVLSFATPKQSAAVGDPVPTSGYLVAFLAYIPAGRAFDRIGVTVTTTVASATLRIAYHRIGSGGLPGTRIVAHAGSTINCATPGAKTATVSSTGEGWCWCVFQTGGATAGFKGALTPIVLSTLNPTTTNVSMFSPRSDADIPADLTGFTWATQSPSSYSIGMWRPV